MMLKTLLQIPHDAVMMRTRSFSTPERYTTKTIWLSSLMNIHQSDVLVGILPPLTVVTCTSIVVALLRSSFPGVQAGKSLAQMHSLLGGAGHGHPCLHG